MDGSRFDAWTRRRFGLAAGGLAGALLGLVGRDDAVLSKKKGKKKKRCRRAGQGCTSGKKRKCCKNLDCQSIEARGGAKLCCREVGGSCSLETQECCSGLCNGVECFCKTAGGNCEFDANCCSPLTCEGGMCAAL
jgi:hypothetical protein